MHMTEKVATIFVKTVVIVLGCIAVACMYVVEHMGGVLSVSYFFSKSFESLH